VNILPHIARILCLSLLVLLCATPVARGDSTACFDKADLDALPVDVRKRILLKKKPIISAYWLYPPPVRLCKDSGVTSSRLRRAINYWEKLGYTFGTVIVEENMLTCAQGGFNGEITILLVTSEVPMGDKIALTRNYKYTATKEVVKSQIYINHRAAERELILEHEIGHALGWSHFNSPYHIMNSLYPNAGHSSSGVGYSSYLDEIGRILASQSD
jgi:hypothetical protein